MSGSENPRNTWLALLTALPRLTNISTDRSITDQGKFDEHFRALCARVREGDRKRLLGSFGRFHDPIITFTYILDNAFGFDQGHSLKSVFWPIAFATVKAALNRNRKDRLFNDFFPRLNDSFPSFGPRLSEFESSANVQTPLQNIFEEYIGCYVDMLVQFSSQTAPSLTTFESRLDTAGQVFTASKSAWERWIRDAEEQRRLALSHPSFPERSLSLSNIVPTRATFEFIEKLGNGSFGEVFKVREVSTKTLYALKVVRIKNPEDTTGMVKAFENEVEIMQKLRHCHISSVQFHTRVDLTLNLFMLPVADCDLLSFLQRCARSDFPREKLTRLTSWFGCLSSALAFAHLNQVTHKDIKPNNILIKSYHVYITDFGCARDFSGLEHSRSPDMLAFGSPVYRAPESPQARGRAADVFSLGCVFSEMLTVRQRRSLRDYQDYREVSNCDNPFAFKENLSGISEWIRTSVNRGDDVGELIMEQTLRMLEEDPRSRPEMKNVRRVLMQEHEKMFCDIC